MKKRIIDGNSVGHAAHRATKLTSGKLQTQAVFGFIRSLRDMMVKTPDFAPLVLWDGKAQWRYDLHPLYKSNRENDPKKVEERERYKEQRPYIARALEHLGVRQMTVFTHEADDMAGYLVEKIMSTPGNEIILTTGDEDWLQLLRPGVTWQDHRDVSKVITLDNLLDRTGYSTPFAFLEGKCLQGDSSDVISGVGGIGEGTAPEFLAEFGSVSHFWRDCDTGKHVPKNKAQRSLWQGTSTKTKEEWATDYRAAGGDTTDKKAFKKHMDDWPGQGRILFKRNFRLMQLLRVEKPDPKNVQVVTGKLDKDKFAEVCEELAFGSILRTLDTFIKPFQELK